MVRYGEYRVVSFGWGEFGNEVHCDYFEWLGLGVSCNREQAGFLMVSVDFVRLAYGASSDVFFHVLSDVRPPIFLLYQVVGVRNSRVSAMRRVVKNGYHPPLKFVAAGNNLRGVFPPGAVFVAELV